MAKTPEQIEKDKARNAAIRAAKDTVRGFFGHVAFRTLDEHIQDALRTLAPVARKATNTMALELAELFADSPTLSELDIFKAMKIGPNEMKAKVNHCLKTVDPGERMWISYDSAECAWSLDAVGPEMPADFEPQNLIPSIIDNLADARYREMTFVALIALKKAEAAETETETETETKA